MKAQVSFVAWLTAGAVCLTLAAAQEKPRQRRKPPQPPAMAMPKPTPEMERLNYMIGAWNIVAKYEPSEESPGGTGRGREVIRRGPGGLSLISDFRATGPMGKFSGHGIILWDPAEQVYKVFWVDSLMPGVLLTSRGRWEGNDLVFVSDEYVAMGRKLKMKQVMTDITPTSGTNLSYISADGGPMKLAMTLKYAKAESRQAPP